MKAYSNSGISSFADVEFRRAVSHYEGMTDMTRAEAYEYYATSRTFVENGIDPDCVEPPAFETADEISQRLFGTTAMKFAPEVPWTVTLTGEQMAELTVLTEATGTPIQELIRQAVDNMLFDARYDGAFDGE